MRKNRSPFADRKYTQLTRHLSCTNQKESGISYYVIKSFKFAVEILRTLGGNSRRRGTPLSSFISSPPGKGEGQGRGCQLSLIHPTQPVQAFDRLPPALKLRGITLRLIASGRCAASRTNGAASRRGHMKVLKGRRRSGRIVKHTMCVRLDNNSPRVETELAGVHA